MTNEEFKKSNNEFIDAIVATEMALINNIKIVFPDVIVPQSAYTYKNKVNELLTLFEKDQTPIDEKITVVLETQYLFSKYLSIYGSIEGYVSSLCEAIARNDNDNAKFLLGIKEELEKTWIKNDTELSNFDFKNGLKEVLDSDVPRPKNMSNEEIYNKCIKELERVCYEPKEEPIINSEPGFKLVQ